MQKGNNEPQEIINEMKRKEQTQALDATDAAAIGAAGASAGAAGYYGAKLGADKVKQKLDFQQALFEADVDDPSPFIAQDPPDIPEVEGGFGSPEQRQAASETSAGKRRVQTALKSQDLYVPEFAPSGAHQPLDYKGRSRFRDHMKTPGKSNPNLGELFDYVTEGTVPLMQEFENLNNPDVVKTMDPKERAARIDALGNILDEVAPNRTSRSEGRVGMARFNTEYGKPSTYLEDFINFQSSDFQAVNELRELDKIINDPSRSFDERVAARMKQYDVSQESGKRHVRAFDEAYEKDKRNRQANKPRYDEAKRIQFEDQYRKMVADDFGKKIEMGLDNAKRYLDQRQVAKTLVRRRPEFMKGAIKSGAAAATVIPDPTDLAMLALAGPYEMMFETGIGKEPGTGTFDIPLANTLGNASRLLDKPLDSRELNEATRIRLAEDDYPLASALFNQDVLSKEAFDHVTGIRKSRGLDTTVLPEQKEPAPEPEPAMGRPGRRF
tara:strand:+ start:1332 stop:2819 length:1488 start_codon:yes stop_codon:yes gene_type:complete